MQGVESGRNRARTSSKSAEIVPVVADVVYENSAPGSGGQVGIEELVALVTFCSELSDEEVGTILRTLGRARERAAGRPEGSVQSGNGVRLSLRDRVSTIKALKGGSI